MQRLRGGCILAGAGEAEPALRRGGVPRAEAVVVVHGAREAIGGAGVERRAMGGPGFVATAAALRHLRVEDDFELGGEGVAGGKRRVPFPPGVPREVGLRVAPVSALERRRPRSRHLPAGPLSGPQLASRRPGCPVGEHALGRARIPGGLLVGVGMTVPCLRGVFERLDALGRRDRIAMLGLGVPAGGDLGLEGGARGANRVGTVAERAEELRQHDRGRVGALSCEPRPQLGHRREERGALAPPLG